MTRCLQTLSDELKRLFEKYVVKIQDFKKVHKVKELVPISELNGVRSLCRLFDLFATAKNGVSPRQAHPRSFYLLVY